MRRPSASSSLVRLAAVALASALAACGPSKGGDDDDDDDGPGPDSGPGDVDAAATEQCRKMDLVFVIDDSQSMDEEQAGLANNFPMFADVLNNYTVGDGTHLDYRAAITTTGITASYNVITPSIPGFPPLPPVSGSQSGADGAFRQTCGMTRPWLEPGDPNMAATFACAANVGTNGPAYEMPLRAAELAVDPAVNPGFVREDALLGLVLITDEDDCSRRQSPFETHGDGCAFNGDTDLATIPSFVAGFDERKGGRARWAAAVMAGTVECTSAFGHADEAARMKQFAQEGGTNVAFGDLCQGNLALALQQALDTFQTACENFPPIGKPVRDRAAD
jgi:hypothetical protein